MIDKDDLEPVPGMDENPQADEYRAWREERRCEEEGLCVACAGSGEGMYDGSRCASCGGSGVPRDYDEEERYNAAREDYDDARREERALGMHRED